MQVRIMSSKMEADYKKAVEVEQQNRTKEQLLHSLDKIRSPISVCEITKDTIKVLFANHTWSFLAGRHCPHHVPTKVSPVMLMGHQADANSCNAYK